MSRASLSPTARLTGRRRIVGPAGGSGGGGRSGEPVEDLRCVGGPAEVEALGVREAHGGELSRLLGGLDAFGDGAQVERAGQRSGGLNDAVVVGVGHAGDEGAVE